MGKNERLKKAEFSRKFDETIKKFDEVLNNTKTRENLDKRETLNKIYRIWKRYPDLRFGQLIGTVHKDLTEMFYLGNKEFIEKLDKGYIKLDQESKYKK